MIGCFPSKGGGESRPATWNTVSRANVPRRRCIAQPENIGLGSGGLNPDPREENVMAIALFKSFLGGELDKVAHPAERRSNARRKVLLWSEIFPIERFGSFVARNISRTGLAGDTETPLKPGQTLLFSIEQNSFHMGTVRWTKGTRFGADLADALGIFGLQNEIEPGAGASHQPRARRYDVDVEGRIAIAAAALKAKVRDVSQSGLRLDSDAQLAPGEQIIVRLRDRPLILAKVRWVASGQIGVETADRIAALRLVYSYE